MQVVGVDGVKEGWVVVALRDGCFEQAAVHAGIGAIAAAYPDAEVIGIDIPIGLPTEGVRAADAAARRFVGGGRASTVFSAPPRAVLEAPTYAQARSIALAVWTQGVSAQAYRLGPKILEAAASSDPRLLEIHPEVSFRALSGRPLRHSKKTWDGQMERRAALRRAGIRLPDRLGGTAGGVPPDDLLDAAVVAWSAARHAAGESASLPDPPQRGADGVPIAIWY